MPITSPWNIVPPRQAESQMKINPKRVGGGSNQRGVESKKPVENKQPEWFDDDDDDDDFNMISYDFI